MRCPSLTAIPSLLALDPQISQNRARSRVLVVFFPPLYHSQAPWRHCAELMSTGPRSVSTSIEENDPDRDIRTPDSDTLIQYVVLRRDLIDSWPLGSVVTQGCHASVGALWANREDPHTVEYCSERNLDHMHKVTLEVKGEAQILNLSEKLVAGGIAHKLWIEQPENIPTCLATKPYPKSVVSTFFKRLKLCK